MTEDVSIRVFADLWDLYRSEPAPAEIERILSDFTIEYIDGDGADQKWTDYGFDFNPGAKEPSRLVIVAHLDALRRQRFEEAPTLIGDHETVYDWLRSVVHTIRVDLGLCDAQVGGTGGGGFITVGPGLAHWGFFFSNTCSESDDIDFAPYASGLGLLVHEARHSEPGDPGHLTQCNGLAGDVTLENGSGYAWAAKYHMWVYGHAILDPPYIRHAAPHAIHARSMAQAQLGRVCGPGEPTHSDPRVQALVDELTAG